MDFIKDQQLWFDTALSYRTRVEKSSLGGVIEHIRNNIDTLQLETRGEIVFSVFEEIIEANCTILGIEFIVPVNKKFESSIHYVFKPVFKLENAIMTKYSGEINGILETKNKLLHYVSTQSLSTITNVYYSIKQFSGSKIVANAYIGINGNTL